MGVTYTKEQQQVIDLRDRNILVSAAAGSGKTAVLVERIITRLTKDTNPLDVDQLLVVTYTEAAASEMKERIQGAIEKALEQQPDNVHLQRQATLIHQAQITTIHRFCLSVIRDYFYTIDLDPSFRVGEEGELKLLKQDVVEQVLEAAYEENSPKFVRFVESFASGKDDRKLEELVLQLYEFSRSYPNPEGWLSNCIKQYDVDSVDKLEQHSFVADIVSEVKEYLQDIQKLLEFGIRICEEEDGPTVYRDALEADGLEIRSLQKAESFRKLQQAISQVQWMKLPSCRDKMVSEKKQAQVKSIRDEVKGLIKSLAEQYFFASIQEMQKDMFDTKEHMQTLAGLVTEFAQGFQEAKREKNLIDFTDMEQYALQILTRKEQGSFVPSQVAGSYQQKFAEVMIDEYQDSNLVQEAILTSVSKVSKGIYNIFMVGDVKQSIYRFRLSRPELFMEKFNTYTMDESRKQRIDLHKNFRSRQEVLHSTNFIFEQIMIPAFGGIAYDEKAALYVGADYEQKDGNETEVLLLEAPESKTDERMELEAEMVAKRIRELVTTHTVKDKKTGKYRKVRYGDIVILIRSLKGWTDVFSRVLNRAGIPTYTSSREGYFQTQEIQLILNYLKILDNPRQDIPFTAVLTSMFVRLTSEELALVKSTTNGRTMYECVCSYVQEGELEGLKEQLKAFLAVFHDFRGRVPYTAIHTLLWQILEETGYGDYAAALPGGEQRVANLEMLIEKAVAFEGTSYKGLFNFVRYIEQLQKYAVDYGEANLMDEMTDVVSLMSIHKSKGLEFPIVFVSGTAKKFNMQDTRGSIVVHPELGVGMDAVDAVLRTKAPTLLKRSIQKKAALETAAEELRVLYVAMTRAKEKLILTGSVTDLEKELDGIVSLQSHQERELPYYSVTKANKYLDWILTALYRNQCMAGILEECDLQIPYANSVFHMEVPIQVKRITMEDMIVSEEERLLESHMTREILHDWDTKKAYDPDTKEWLQEQFSYIYPYETDPVVKQKLSVSELKKRDYMEEAEEVFREEEVIPLLPKFLQEQEELTGASRGTAYHKLLEVLDFTKEYDEEILWAEMQRKQESGALTEEMVACIRVEDILKFLDSSIGKRVQQASRLGRCYAEQPFVLGVEADKVYEGADPEEYVLVQGIIDLYFEEEGQLVVLDYKTDRVFAEKELYDRYHTQLDYYAQALGRLTDKPVKEKVIYSFTLQKEIEV